MSRKRFKSNPRLWAISSGVVFVVLGFVDPWAGASKGEHYWWREVVRLPTLNRHQLGVIVPPVLVYGAGLALAALILGWVVQAVIAMRRGPVLSRYEVLTEQLRDVKS